MTIALENIKRAEQLDPGDRVKVWGEDLTVVSQTPVAVLDAIPSQVGTIVTYTGPAGEGDVFYPAGVLVEIEPQPEQPE